MLGLGLLGGLSVGAAPESAWSQAIPPIPPEVDAVTESNAEETLSDTQRASVAIISRTIRTRVDDALRPGSAFSAGFFFDSPGTDEDDEDPDNEESRLLGADPALAYGQQGAASGKLGEGQWFEGSLSLWVSPSVTFVENDFSSTAFDGTIVTPLAGVDYTLTDGPVVGLALGYERVRLDTSFIDGSVDSDAFVVTPYVGWAPIPELLLTAGFSYNAVNFDSLQRLSPGPTVTGDFDGSRLSGFASATGYAPNEWHGIEPLTLSATLGTRLSRERQDAHTNSLGFEVEERTAYLGQLNFSIRGAYAVGWGGETRGEVFIEPGFNYDYRQSEVDVLSGARAGSRPDRGHHCHRVHLQGRAGDHGGGGVSARVRPPECGQRHADGERAHRVLRRRRHARVVASSDLPRGLRQDIFPAPRRGGRCVR